MIIEMQTACDLSETTLDDARLLLRAPRLADLAVYAGESQATRARHLQGLHGFELCIFPDHLLRCRWTWGARYLGDYAWTDGAG